MQEQQNTAATGTTATGPVTIDNVRAALGDVSPFDTNASKLRVIIGRGSNATIQKFLDIIRSELIASIQPQTSTDTIPNAPADLVAAVWGAAWSTAQVRTLARLEKLSAERDGLQATTDAQAADVSALTEQLDALEAQSQAHAQALANAESAALEQTIAATALSAAQTDALTAAHAETARVKEAATHAAELAVRDTQIERLALQSTIDRMSDQLGELKALRITAQAHDESLANVQAAALATAEKTQAAMQTQAAALASAQAEIVRVREAAAHAAELAAIAAEKERQNLLSIIDHMKSGSTKIEK